MLGHILSKWVHFDLWFWWPSQLEGFEQLHDLIFNYHENIDADERNGTSSCKQFLQ